MMELWTNEYFIDKLERHVKNEISMKYHVQNDRIPTKEEYETTFDNWVSKLKCNVTDYDLGIFE